MLQIHRRKRIRTRCESDTCPEPLGGLEYHMPHRLLVVQEESSCSTDIEAAFGAPAGHQRCTRSGWRDFDVTTLGEDAADLVVPVAVPPREEAMEFFEWLRSHAIHAPTLAVVPAEMDSRLLDRVAEVVDDFLLWPARPEECRHRVARLLGPPDPNDEWAASSDEVGLSRLVGRHPGFVRAVAQLPALARSGRPV